MIDFKKPLPWLVSAVILYFVIRYWGALEGVVLTLISAALPLILGAVIAYVVNLPMSFYERHWFPGTKNAGLIKLRRPLCLTLAFLTIILLAVFVVQMVIPELVECIKFLISEIPPLLDRVLTSEFATNTLPDFVLDKLTGINWQDLITKAVNLVMSGLGSVAGTVMNLVTALVGWLVTAFVAVVFAIYALYNKEGLNRQYHRLAKNYLPKKASEGVLYVARVADDSFHKFIVGQCTEALILGALTVGGMLLFRFPYAAMVGTLVGFLALIPIAGAYISAAVGALMILTVSPMKALLFVVFLVVLQQIEGNLIYPKVVGNSIGLPAMWVLAAISVGGTVAGIPGMLLGVPVAATLYRLIREDMSRREAKHAPKKPEKPQKTDTPPANTP